MEQVPVYISILFILITLLTVWFFYKATGYSKLFIVIVSVWLLLQTVVSLTGFYAVTNTTPPRFVLLIAPPLLLIIILFATARGRRFIDRLNPKTLTLLHIVRVPVELVLLGLSVYKVIPQLMTFEGSNFDILSGLSAPIIWYVGFVKKRIPAKLILLWNFICLGLLLNIVIRAVLSAPFPFQQLAFNQPNVAILYFPFTWLPGCVVPLVLLSHLVTIRQLLIAGTKKKFFSFAG